MTRINCVPVQELSGPHLVAEYRELPRVFALARKAAARGVVEPTACYTLGKGHLLFFYTRLGYLVRRHAELIAEMKRRGYKPAFEGLTRQQFPELPEGTTLLLPPLCADMNPDGFSLNALSSLFTSS